MSEIPTLETDRLILRGPRPADLAPFVDFYASEERTRFNSGPLAPDVAARKFVALVAHWRAHGYGRWIVEEAETGGYCGHAGMLAPSRRIAPRLTWSLTATAEGRGIAFEAATAARAWAFKALGAPSLVSLVHPDNARSIALAGRLGAVVEGAGAFDDGTPCLRFRHRPAKQTRRGARAGDAA